MAINPGYSTDIQVPEPSIPVPGPDVIDEGTAKPDRDVQPLPDEPEPSPDWKDPDDGKSLSDLDTELPLKP